MTKSLLIYGEFSRYSATDFIIGLDTLLDKNIDTEVQVAINSNGGEVDYGWGMIHKFQQFPNKKSVINHGKAYSMALYFNCYTDDTSCLDVTEFLLHRAAYAEWVENDPELFNDDRKKSLKQMNDKLRAAFEAKVDVDKFNNLKVMKDKGITLDDVFSLDSRIDVKFNAREAKSIGLVKNIVTITPKIQSEIEANFDIAAKYSENNNNKNPKNDKPLTPKKMTKAEFKANHPELYAEIYNEGVTAGTDAEVDRVGSIMAFAEIDPAMVKTAIASGKKLTETQRNELLLKAAKTLRIEDVAADSSKPVETGAVKTAEQLKAEADKKANDDFLADVKAGR